MPDTKNGGQMTGGFPDPSVDRYNVWAIYPFMIDFEKSDTAGVKSLKTWIQNPVLPQGSPWRALEPRELRDQGIGRFFLCEIRSMFFNDLGSDDDVACDTPPPGKPPGPGLKFRWMSYEDGQVDCADGTSPFERPLLKNYRLGIFKEDKKSPTGLSLTLLSESFTIKVSAIVSAAQVLFIVIRLESKKNRALSELMNLNHQVAYGDLSNMSLILVPTSLAGKMTRQKREAGDREAAGESQVFPLTAKEAEELLLMNYEHLSDRTHHRQGFKNNGSLAWNLGQSLKRQWAGAGLRFGFHGRIPIVSHFQLHWRESWSTPDAVARDELDRIRDLEYLAARSQRHPSVSENIPLSLEEIQGEEFRTVHFTGSQRAHISSEGMTAFGFGRTRFDVSTWPDRFAKDYLATFFIAMHQALVCQDLSWKSYKETSGSRDNEALLVRFIEYNRDFDFALVSNQLNIQRLYRNARETLGVDRMVSDVREELDSWLEKESREEQQSLNSIAVIAVLASVASIFVGLNLNYFTNDSNVALLWGNGVNQVSGLLWFWLPAAAVVAFSLISKNIRGHFKRIWRMVWKNKEKP